MRDSVARRHGTPIRVLLIFSATVLAFLVGMIGSQTGIEAALAAMGMLIVWIFLASRPALPLAILLAGFYYYPLIFDTLGLQIDSTTTATFYALLASSTVVGAFRRNSMQLRTFLVSPASLSLMAFFIWSVMNAMLLTPFSGEPQQKLSFAVLLMLAPYFAAGLLDTKTRNRFVSIVIALGVTGVLLVALTVIINPGVVRTGRFVLSQHNSPLTLAYALGMSAIFALAAALDSSRRHIWFMAIALLGSASSIIVLSGSRGPLIALALASVAMVLSKTRGRRFEVFFGLIIIATLIIILAPLAPGWARFDRILDFVVTLQETGDVDEQLLTIATSGRTAIWQDSINAWRSSPLVGVGLGNYPAGAFSHNFAIEILTELGLFGMALFILFFSAVILSLRRLMTQSDDPMMVQLTVGLLVFALVHMSLSGRLQTSTDFWLAAGLACGLSLRLSVRSGARVPALAAGPSDKRTR